jgi:hypothetical protein
MPTTSPIRINTRTTSIQHLCGLLNFYTIPLSCLLDLNRFSLTLSTSYVKFSIFLSVSSISRPVRIVCSFHLFTFSMRTSSPSSNLRSFYSHRCMAAISTEVGESFVLFLFDWILLFTLLFAFGSNNCVRISVYV